MCLRQSPSNYFLQVRRGRLTFCKKQLKPHKRWLHRVPAVAIVFAHPLVSLLVLCNGGERSAHKYSVSQNKKVNKIMYPTTRWKIAWRMVDRQTSEF